MRSGVSCLLVSIADFGAEGICRESQARRAREQTAITARAEEKKWVGPRSCPLVKQTKLQESWEDSASQSMTAITAIGVNSPGRRRSERATREPCRCPQAPLPLRGGSTGNSAETDVPAPEAPAGELTRFHIHAHRPADADRITCPHRLAVTRVVFGGFGKRNTLLGQ